MQWKTRSAGVRRSTGSTRRWPNPAEMSLHQRCCFHASAPNRSADRRIGVAIRYVTPEVRQADMARDYAILVRGKDAMTGWINVAAPSGLFDESAMALYEEVLMAQSAVLSAGAEAEVEMYRTGERTEGRT
jgi:hypothetical protein